MKFVVKCLDCGNEYYLDQGEKPDDYQCECGGKLFYKYNSNNLSKPKKILKFATISIFSFLIVFIAVFTIFPFVYPAEHQTVNNNTPTNIANSTYAANGITFDYPAEMIKINNLNNTNRWGLTDPEVAFFEPEANKTEFDDINTYFYIKQRSASSLDEQLSFYRYDIKEIGQTEVSERNITVNGMKAVELIKTWHASGKQFKALTIHIEAVPGSLYYRIGCVTPADEFDSNLPKFEIIVHSFKLL